MKTLSLDIESYSSVNLSKCGTYRYAECDEFEILLFAYSIDGGEVQVIDVANGEEIPEEVYSALSDDTVLKYAFNANFERICLSKFLGMPTGQYLNPKSWRCTMVSSATLGLPLSLEGVGAVLGLDKQKLSEGKNLIRYFCVPCIPTKVNGGRIRNLPNHDKAKWETFKSYNKRDVEVELEIQKQLSKFPVTEELWAEYHLDQEINDRGILIDLEFVKQAVELDKTSKQAILDELKNLTGLENPNSVLQMREWLKGQGLEVESLGKETVTELLDSKIDEKLKQVLLLRQQLAKSSVKKYQTMLSVAGSDHRARGMFMFYGANRTGRWSGRLIQLQNLYRNTISDLAEVRTLVKQGNVEAIHLLYDNVPEVLAQLIRTAFVPKENYKFIVSDFSSIEAIVLAWLSGETWVVNAYANREDLYIKNAERMFGAKEGTVDKHSELRQKSKIATLACGYGGAVGALNAFGATSLGMKEEELKPTVDAWRNANPHIVQFWWAVDRAVKQVVKTRSSVRLRNLSFHYQSGILFITLPSGRKLAYVKPRIGENKFGGECVTYEGIGLARKWERINSYGPKFVENITQAVARDILAYAMQVLREYNIVASVHDEVILEVPKDIQVETINNIMCQMPDWAKGLPMRAEGYECNFYKKD
ncbi:DNA polymerase [Pilibacter termitis]|uniref:DNA-directed DNA polymerase n=1 Tax=Pilibacter termitis TaxID=263852 RepID=A0A1T4PRD1_9ENTE|nr:DNA polymerase [Pilibacter termitis]SJZ94152.1 DNA polymerase [Pilibacter termitis]